MIVFLTDPTGLSEEAASFYKEKVIGALMDAQYQMRAGWSLAPPSFVMYDCDPRQEEWHHRYLVLSNKLQDQVISHIKDSDVVLAMMEGTEPSCFVAAAMSYGYAVGKAVFVYKHNRERVVGKAYASAGTLAEYFSHITGGGVFTSVEELLAGLVSREAVVEHRNRF